MVGPNAIEDTSPYVYHSSSPPTHGNGIKDWFDNEYGEQKSEECDCCEETDDE